VPYGGKISPMVRGARLYFSESTKPAIIAALHRTSNHVWYEQETPELLSRWRDGAQLAEAMFRAIERFSIKDVDFRTRNNKLTNWPAFRASKCRSVNAFQRAYDCISVRSLNEHELFFTADMSPRGEDDIELRVLINPNNADTETSRKLLRLLHAYRRWEPLPFSAGLTD
jgi:hypothetical protein